MKRKKLEALPVEERHLTEKRRYEFVPHIEDVDGEQHLVIEAYYGENREPNYRIFVKNDDYGTLDVNRKVWTRKEILDIVGRCWTKKNGKYGYYAMKGVLITETGRNIMKNYTGITDEQECERLLAEYQRKIREEKLEERDRKVTEGWDRQIGNLPTLPDDWDKFIQEEVAKNHYVFFQKTDKGITGTCTYCGKKSENRKMRHKERGKCPYCGKKVIHVNTARKDELGEYRNAWIVQTQGERTIIRTFKVGIRYRRTDSGDMKKETNQHPNTMIILEGKKNTEWVWGRYKQRGDKRWCSSMYSRICAWEDGCMYRRNAGEWKQNTQAKYLPLESIPYEIEMNPKAIFKNSQKNIDVAEKIMKIGLWELGKEALKGKFGASKKIKDILGTENDDLEILKQAETDMNQYRFFMTLKKEGKRPDTQELEQYGNMNMPLSMIEKMIPYTTFHQIYKRYKYNSREIIERYYEDYFNMCKDLGFDMKSTFVLFPKNIKKAHDDLTLYYNEKKDEAEGRRRNRIYAKVADMAEELNEMYGVEDEEYLVRAPRDAAEIIKEGHAMHHCVGGKQYTENMTKGSSYILFIRKKSDPEKPWYTMEISSDHTVLQVRGFANMDKDNIRGTSIWKLLTVKLKELRERDRIKAVAG